MKIQRKVLREIYETEDIKCNMCGNPIQKTDAGIYFEHISINKKWEYISDFDGQEHNVDICQNCYKKIIDNFKIKP